MIEIPEGLHCTEGVNLRFLRLGACVCVQTLAGSNAISSPRNRDLMAWHYVNSKKPMEVNLSFLAAIVVTRREFQRDKHCYQRLCMWVLLPLQKQ